MARDLVSLTVYLPPVSKADAEKRAEEKSISTGTLLRMVLLGKEPPLKS